MVGKSGGHTSRSNGVSVACTCSRLAPREWSGDPRLELRYPVHGSSRSMDSGCFGDTRMREPRSTLSGRVYGRRATRVLPALCDHLTDRAGISPNRLVPMEMIDIGGASGQDGNPLRWSSVLELGYCVPCEGKGFFRPSILHISPDGGVRTCLYAPGGGWLGSVNRESLLDIVNRFPENLVTAAFTSGEAESFAETHIKPYAQVYRSVNHPCAALAVLARAIEATSEPNAVPSVIHERIASDFNIHA